jgi:O-acetyl-ADP-ribose deacetylase (regulator of RNase III)
MITYVVCDLFESPARVLVNTVNTVGVMGKGIARDFKRIYPDMFTQYQRLCEQGTFDIGNLWLYKTPHKWVLNFPTKKHWRQPSRPEYIEAGLMKFANTYHVHGITSISFPLLGCGNGELDWETQVQPLMEQYLRPLPVRVYIHLMAQAVAGAPGHRNIREMKKWLQGEPESLAFAEVWDDLASMLQDSNNIPCINKEESFQAEVRTAREELVLRIGDDTVAIPRDTFMDLWQQIRQAGFVSGNSLPDGLDFYADHVVSLMTLLPYVEPVVMAGRSSELSSQTAGLRLTPRPTSGELPAQLPLLAGMVEPE